MRKSALVTVLILLAATVFYVMRAKRAAEEEAELWSEALDPVF